MAVLCFLLRVGCRPPSGNGAACAQERSLGFPGSTGSLVSKPCHPNIARGGVQVFEKWLRASTMFSLQAPAATHRNKGFVDQNPE